MALSFAPVTDKDKRVFDAYGRSTVYRELLDDFVESGEEIVKVNGFSMTESIQIYNSLITASKHYNGIKVAKRGSNLYLLNRNINHVIDPVEPR